MCVMVNGCVGVCEVCGRMKIGRLMMMMCV